jgi:hypothetical protein
VARPFRMKGWGRSVVRKNRSNVRCPSPALRSADCGRSPPGTAAGAPRRPSDC